MADVIKVTNTGLSIITGRIKGQGVEPNYLSTGTGTNVANNTDTTLQTPRSEARVACTTTQQTTVATNDTYQAVGTVTYSTTSGAITEAGLFDASSGGNLFLRASFDAININPGDSIQMTIKVQFVSA